MSIDRKQRNLSTINVQKQIGAYYTGEDITTYISKNTIIPAFFDAVQQKHPAVFAPASPLWSLLREQPDQYVYKAMRKGCDLPLSRSIEAGIHDVARRATWNQAASVEYALPLETWREVVARRQRYREIKEHLSEGAICAIDEMLTLNLDLCRLAQDVLINCTEADLLLIFYESLTSLTILDPTCGSGAFLLAAQAILEPLYETCLERMQSMIAASENQPHLVRCSGSATLERFRAVLHEARRYPSRRYFIDQSIISHNLYGVDIMEEATASCQQRLLLKLLVEGKAGADLPPVECHIRTGNALVGCTTMDAFPDDSVDISQEWLDSSLAAQYGLNPAHMPADYVEKLVRWKQSHQPFHWCLEFQEVMQRGGFDIIIGNPPYISYSQTKKSYQVCSYQTQSCGNLYAYTLERALTLLRAGGRCGMIVPVSAISSVSYRPLSRLLLQHQLWVSSYSNRPGRLFNGVEQRLAILLMHNAPSPALFASAYQHWYEQERAHLFDTLAYTSASTWLPTNMPIKSGSARAEAIFARLTQHQGFPLLNSQESLAAVWVHNGPTYWVRALPFEPNIGHRGQRSWHYLKIPVSSQAEAFLISAILSSSTFYFFYKIVSNCRDLGHKELHLFPLGQLQPALAERLTSLGRLLAQRLQATASTCSRQYPSGTSAYEEYYPARAKAILDQIDRVLAEQYGFSEDELDFLINYGIKYRMGRENLPIPADHRYSAVRRRASRLS